MAMPMTKRVLQLPLDGIKCNLVNDGTKLKLSQTLVVMIMLLVST